MGLTNIGRQGVSYLQQFACRQLLAYQSRLQLDVPLASGLGTFAVAAPAPLKLVSDTDHWQTFGTAAAGPSALLTDCDLPTK